MNCSNCTQDGDSMSSWCGWHTDHGSLTGDLLIYFNYFFVTMAYGPLINLLFLLGITILGICIWYAFCPTSLLFPWFNMNQMWRSLCYIVGISLQNYAKKKKECICLQNDVKERIPTRIGILSMCLISASIQHVGLTCAMFTRDAVEIPCPDSAAGLYIRTRTDQIVKVYFLVPKFQQCKTQAMMAHNCVFQNFFISY